MKYTKIASRSSFTGGFMVVFSCCMLATHMVYGADAPAKAYALTKEGSKKNNTFATPAFWKDFSTGEEAPTVASKSDAKGLEYIITNRYVVRTQNASPTIYGHVTVGSTKSPGTIFNKCYGRRVNYEGGLTVVSGAYEAIGAGGAMDDAGKTAAQIGGKIEVLSPSKKPFVFGGDNRQEVVIAADIAGAENTGILIGSAKYKWTDYKTTTLSGDNSKYLGAIEFGRATHITNFITTAKSLGGAPSKLNKEALKLTSRGEATLFFRSSVGKCVVPATRGISLNGVAGGGGAPCPQVCFRSGERC